RRGAADQRAVLVPGPSRPRRHGARLLRLDRHPARGARRARGPGAIAGGCGRGCGSRSARQRASRSAPANARLCIVRLRAAVAQRIELPEALVARRRAFAGLWLGIALVYAAVAPIRMARFAERISPKGLIQRIDETLPAGNRLAVCGLGDDRSLVLLYYFRDPRRIDVAPEGTSCAPSATGYYLMSDADWRRAGRWGEAGQWNELLRGEIRGWSRRLPVIFARRGADGEDLGVQTASGTDPLHR